MTVCVISLGCPKNLVDSEVVAGYLGRDDFTLTDDPESADAVAVATCSFIALATQESIDTIDRIVGLKRRGAVQRIVVIGCLVQRYGDTLKKRFPEVDAFLGIDQLERIGRACRTESGVFYSQVPKRLYNEPRLLSTPSHYAYLKISDGCDNRCSYCTIPGIRGRFRSRPPEEIISEARDLAARGVKELIVVGQDTTRYGYDLNRKYDLARLLPRLAAIDGVEWIRLLYTHPAHYTDELIRVVAQTPEIVKYVDLPLQHISDRVLKKMNRRYTREKARELIGRLRSIPGMAIRTTFIAGFPGETRDDFEELFEFVRVQHFDSVGVFPYSREEGTRAFGFAHRISPAVTHERTRRLMELQKAISKKLLRSWIGKNLDALVDVVGDAGRTGGPTSCRTYFQSPEIDGRLLVQTAGVTAGDVVRVKITRTTAYDLIGTINRPTHRTASRTGSLSRLRHSRRAEFPGARDA